MLTPAQVFPFYEDLTDKLFETHIAMVHSRFSTNTFPSWDRAQPNRFMSHNGEINTLRGNINRMIGRRANLKSPLYENISELYPIIIPRGSDSACMDNVFEFLIQSGYTPAHAMMMMVPEAWEHNPDMTPEKHAFYEYHEHLMEPWDGPASLTFTNDP